MKDQDFKNKLFHTLLNSPEKVLGNVCGMFANMVVAHLKQNNLKFYKNFRLYNDGEGDATLLFLAKDVTGYVRKYDLVCKRNAYTLTVDEFILTSLEPSEYYEDGSPRTLQLGVYN